MDTDLYKSALNFLELNTQDREHANKLAEVGSMFFDQGYFKEAFLFYDKARGIYDANFDLGSVAEMDLRRGKVLRNLGRYQEALDLYDKVESIFKEQMFEDDIARVYTNKSAAYLAIGQFQKAIEFCDMARPILIRYNMLMDAAAVDFNKAVALRNLGRYQDSLSQYGKAKPIYKKFNKEIDLAKIDMAEAVLYCVTSDYKKASMSCDKALSIFRRHNHKVLIAQTLMNKAAILKAESNFLEAQNLLENAQSIFHERNMILDVAKADLALAGIFSSSKKYRKALEHFRKVRTVFEKYNLTKLNADTYRYEAFICLRLNKHQEAFQLLDKAREIYKNHDMKIEIANIDFVKSLILPLLKRHKESNHIRENAVSILKNSKILGLNDPIELFEGINLNEIFLQLCQSEDSLKILDDLITLNEEQDREISFAELTLVKATILVELNHNQEALILCDKAKIIFEKNKLENEIASLNVVKGAAYRRLGKYGEALELYDKAINIFKKNSNEIDLAHTYRNKGYILWLINRSEEAINLYEKARIIYKNLNLETFVASIDMNIAAVYRKVNRLKEASQLYESARKIFENYSDDAELATLEMNQAILLSFLGQPQKAVTLYDKIKKTYKNQNEQLGLARLDMNFVSIFFKRGRLLKASKLAKNAAKIFEEFDIPGPLLRCKCALGVLAELKLNFKKAFEYYKDSIEIIEKIRGSLTSDDYKIGHLEDKSLVYERMVNLCLRLKKYTLAYNYVQRYRARSLQDLLAGVKINPGNIDNLNLLQEIDRLIIKINDLQTQLEEKCTTPESVFEAVPSTISLQGKLYDSKEKNIKELSEELNMAQAEFNSLYQKIKNLYPEYASLIAVDPLSLEEIQSSIDEKSIIVEYFFIEDIREKVVIFIITKSDFQVQVVRSMSMQGLKQKVEEYLYSIGHEINNFGNVINPGYPQEKELLRVKEKAKWIYDKILRPTERFWKNVSGSKINHFIVVPHGVLNHLPFCTLYDGSKFLIEEIPIVQVPSSTIFANFCKKRSSSDSHVSYFGLANPRGNGDKWKNIGNIVGCETVVNKAVDHFWGGNENTVKAVYREEATYDIFLENASKFSILDIETHGKLFSGNPILQSFLVVGKEGEPHWFTAAEAFLKLQLNSDLLILAICQGGKIEVLTGDELIGLVRAFFFAGCRSILVYRWLLLDEAAVILMTKFYDQFIRDKKIINVKDMALQAAQINMIKKGRNNEGPHGIQNMTWEHPYYWAWILTGDYN